MANERAIDELPGAWRAVLGEDIPAVLDGGARKIVDGTAVTPLLDRAWLAFSGPDARQFLHDQLTAGVADLGRERTQLAAYCNAQGRVLAIFRVSAADDGLLAELPALLADSVARRLRLFVLRADVRIEPRDDLAALGVWGPGAESLLAGSGLPVPGNEFERAGTNALAVTRLPGAPNRFQLAGSANDLTAAWRELRTDARPETGASWRALDIRAGLAELGPATSDQFLPQSLGLERWQALSYRKGCYPGQEVIARAHYRGRLKRHLYRARVQAGAPPPGSLLRDSRGGRAGTVLDALADSAGGSELLAVLHERAETGCRLADDAAAALEDLERLPD